MAYTTVYDITQEPLIDLTVAGLSVGIIALGIIWRLIQRAKERKHPERPKVPGMRTSTILIILGSVVAVIGVGLMGFDHWRLVKALQNGEAGVVEGPVQSWGTERVRTANTKKQEFRTYERFYIGDSIWFGYYRDVGQAGFHNAKEPQVVFSDGMSVRATYLYADGKDDPPRIVKLEVQQ